MGRGGSREVWHTILYEVGEQTERERNEQEAQWRWDQGLSFKQPVTVKLNRKEEEQRKC